MAQFVVHLHLRPDDYWALTPHERDALIDEFNRSQKRK
ncbi:phage tail assembly chaperone [Sanguibacter massiliensis]|nr:phage tail assembly chaperone [Sanguibacter massiliensis]